MRPFGLILSLAPLAVFADVKFTAPAAGAEVPVGTISVQWEDSGIAPSIEDLTGYTLVLMVGGNEASNMLALTTFVSQGVFSSGDQASGTIPAGIAGPVPNGFFFKIISSATDGGTVINYSDRFTINGLTGTTDETYRNAVTALGGSTDGPPSVGDGATFATSSTHVPSTTTSTLSTNRPTSIVTTTRSSPATSTPSHTAASGNETGGLSSGALAGIAIVCFILALLGCGFGLWMCLRRRRERRRGTIKINDESSDLSAEVMHKEMTTAAAPVELDPYTRIFEADEGVPPAELDNNVRVELEGDPVITKSGMPRPDSILTEIPQTPLSSMTIGTGTWDSMRMPLPDPTPTAPGTPVTPVSNL